MIWVLSSLIFVCSSTTVSLLLCVFSGQLTFFNSLFSLLCGLGLGVFSFLKFKDKIPRLKKLTYFDWAMILFFGVFSFRHFLWLIFQQGNSILTLDPSNYGDLPHHIAYINFLARGAHFWPIDPLIKGEPFTYPFGIDLFSAMFTKIGFSFLGYLPLMGTAFAILLAIAFLYWGGGFALGSFLFAGGGYGYLFFATHQLKNYQDGKPWGSIILLFTTQRGFLYALPAGLLLLWSWRRRFFSTSENEKPLPEYLEGLIWGTMPFFHVHTFLFLSFIYAFWFLMTTRSFKNLKVFLWAFIPACFEMYFVTGHFAMKSVIWLKPGWMIEHQNILIFFWGNYGVYIFMTLMTLYLSIKRPSAWRQILPGALLFITCYFVMFAPWDWDNIKLMMWCYILILPLMEELALKSFTKPMRAFLITTLFIPGFVAVAAMHNPENRGNEIYTREFYDGVCSALKDIGPEVRFATAQIHNHPVLLCGHPLVAGYAGVLWSHGVDASRIQDKLTRLMKGDPQWHDLARELETRYIFWGPPENYFYPGSTRPWETDGTKILAQGEWGKVFDLGEHK